MYVNLQHLVGGANKYYFFQTELASSPPCVPAVATATMIARYFTVMLCLHVCSSSWDHVS